jgi:predicted SprT family Zn-dependent metalloprotease
MDTPRIPLEYPDVLAFWHRFNQRYFDGRLPPIPIQWSGRLTSSLGLFKSRIGPRTNASEHSVLGVNRRCIRLSLPLVRQMALDRLDCEQVILSTLAHEMIHQWQYDILKRRPDHGPDFRRKMWEINRHGLLSITIYHSLSNQVGMLARHAWRCQRCGEVYRRRRRTIHPHRHVCALCHGRLKEVPEQPDRHTSSTKYRTRNHPGLLSQQDPGVGDRGITTNQLQLPFEPSAGPHKFPVLYQHRPLGPAIRSLIDSHPLGFRTGSR